MESSDQKRRFPAPWRAERVSDDCYYIVDANGIRLASVFCRDDLHRQRWADYQQHLTSDEARRIAKAIARIPELLNVQNHPAFTRSDNPHWSKSHPYHVALADPYVRENYDWIVACCAHNGMPCDRSGPVIEIEGRRWCIYKFARQLDAIRFWDKFDGRWMRCEGFIYPERPQGLPKLREPNDNRYGEVLR